MSEVSTGAILLWTVGSRPSSQKSWGWRREHLRPSPLVIMHLGTSLMVQQLRTYTSPTEGMGLIPGQGTKILHAVWQWLKKKTQKPTVNLTVADIAPNKVTGDILTVTLAIPWGYHQILPRRSFSGKLPKCFRSCLSGRNWWAKAVGAKNSQTVSPDASLPS